MNFFRFIIITISLLILGRADSFSQEKKIMHESVHMKNHFGWAISGDSVYACISDPRDSILSNSNGSVNIYKRVKDKWEYSQTINSPVPKVYEYFGHSVLMKGNYLFVSAIGNNDMGFMSGAVYIFKLEDQKWSYHKQLYPDWQKTKGYFGTSLAINKNYLFVGAPGTNKKGAVYVFELTTGRFQKTQTITFPGIPFNSELGSTIACNSTHLLIGVPKGGHDTLRHGVVYSLLYSGNQWVYNQQLLPGKLEGNTLFGSAISIQKNDMIIGAPHYTIPTDESYYFSGIAYTYKMQNSAWYIQDSIPNPDPSSHDLFAQKVLIADSSIIISAPRNDSYKKDAGIVYMYNLRNSSGYKSYNAINENDQLYFGNSIAYSGGTLWIGLSGNKTNQRKGTVYYYLLQEIVSNLEFDDVNSQVMEIFPNPVNNYLNISISHPNNVKEEYTCKIYNSEGGLLKIITSAKNSLTIPVHEYPAGMYLITVQYEDIFLTKKVVLHR